MATKKSAGWKMAISIGGAFLIPVRLDGVAREAKTEMHEYHKKDMGRGGRKTYCKSCLEEIGTDDIVKGIEVVKGQVVTFTPEELAGLPLATTKNIEIDRFCEASELNLLTFNDTYHLAPDEVGVSAFNLFVRGLEKLGKVAVGKVAVRQREHLCVIRPIGGRLVMSTMYWDEEMKGAPNVPGTEVTDVQLDLITQVIGKYSKPFNHADYSDQYLVALREMAQRKLSGDVVAVAEVQAPPQENMEDALRRLAGS